MPCHDPLALDMLSSSCNPYSPCDPSTFYLEETPIVSSYPLGDLDTLHDSNICVHTMLNFDMHAMDIDAPYSRYTLHPIHVEPNK